MKWRLTRERKKSKVSELAGQLDKTQDLEVKARAFNSDHAGSSGNVTTDPPAIPIPMSSQMRMSSFSLSIYTKQHLRY